MSRPSKLIETTSETDATRGFRQLLIETGNDDTLIATGITSAYREDTSLTGDAPSFTATGNLASNGELADQLEDLARQLRRFPHSHRLPAP